VVVVDSKGKRFSIDRKKQIRQKTSKTKNKTSKTTRKDKRFRIHVDNMVIQNLKRSIHKVKIIDMIKRKKKSYRDHVRRGVEQFTRRYET